MTRSVARGEAHGERLVVLRAADAGGALAGVLLDDVVAELVDEHVCKDEVPQCLAGPGDDGLRAAADDLNARARPRQSVRLRLSEPAGQSPGWQRLLKEQDFARNAQASEQYGAVGPGGSRTSATPRKP